jgi:hypothetical protein
MKSMQQWESIGRTSGRSERSLFLFYFDAKAQARPES